MQHQQWMPEPDTPWAKHTTVEYQKVQQYKLGSRT